MHLRQMGNISASFADGYSLNIVNPASYGFLSATSFEIGVESKFSYYNDGENTENTGSGRLSYMALGFPLSNPINQLLEKQKKKTSIGMAFYMAPVSTVAEYTGSVRQNCSKPAPALGASRAYEWHDLRFSTAKSLFFRISATVTHTDTAAQQERGRPTVKLTGHAGNAGVLVAVYCNREVLWSSRAALALGRSRVSVVACVGLGEGELGSNSPREIVGSTDTSIVPVGNCGLATSRLSKPEVVVDIPCIITIMTTGSRNCNTYSMIAQP